MISTRYAFQRLKVKGQGSDFSTSPALYKGEQNGARGSLGSVGGEEGRAEQSSRFSLVQSGGVGEPNGARSGETGESQDGARVRVEGREERELVNGAGTRRGA